MSAESTALAAFQSHLHGCAECTIRGECPTGAVLRDTWGALADAEQIADFEQDVVDDEYVVPVEIRDTRSAP